MTVIPKINMSDSGSVCFSSSYSSNNNDNENTSTAMPNNDNIKALRARIINAVPNFNKPEYHGEWWLLGTPGCHLCTDAEKLLTRFQAVQPISYQHIDIADFNETLMMEFATTIPVLLTPYRRLNYPFSVMDLQQLV
ncbi:glutaredoxin family protein [Psychrobacter frigidicola]|uniref:glutaredoxin family protein n=1 Tax=Psychrobacter frigidicola TaxID=45611 RepID=UPI001D0FD30F|nr:glutaredoxin family protein [Psychrobacter frigidicola]